MERNHCEALAGSFLPAGAFVFAVGPFGERGLTCVELKSCRDGAGNYTCRTTSGSGTAEFYTYHTYAQERLHFHPFFVIFMQVIQFFILQFSISAIHPGL